MPGICRTNLIKTPIYKGTLVNRNTFNQKSPDNPSCAIFVREIELLIFMLVTTSLMVSLVTCRLDNDSFAKRRTASRQPREQPQMSV